MNVPARVWAVGRWLLFARLGFVGLILLSGHPQAGLELGYKPALVADFPVSLLYLISPKAGPLLAAVVGPIWWFFLPLICWWLIRAWRAKSRHRAI
jgi:hypothetical protein